MSWFKVDDKNPALVHVDADAYMPDALVEIEKLAPDEPAAVKLEVARQWRHWDLDVELRKAGALLADGVMFRHVTGDKARWRVSAAGGEETATVEFSRRVGAKARELYRKARGYSPA